MNTINGENHKVSYNESDNTLYIEGTLRLRGLDEYKPISNFLDQCLENKSLTINVKKLKFLNSSGIAMFSRFVIHARKKENYRLSFIGSTDISWQGKSLKNLQRLMPTLLLIIEN